MQVRNTKFVRLWLSHPASHDHNKRIELEEGSMKPTRELAKKTCNWMLYIVSDLLSKIFVCIRSKFFEPIMELWSSGSSATLKNWSENCFLIKVKDNGQFQPSRCTAARVKLNWMKRRRVIMFCSVSNEFKISHKPWQEGYYFRGSDYFRKQSTKTPAKYSDLIRRIVQKAVSPV